MDFREAVRKWPYLADKRYYSFGSYLRSIFSVRVYKVTLHAGLTCPNRDGSVGVGGCTYCINDSFSPNTRWADQSISGQMLRSMEFLRSRYKAEKFIAYFQTFTNTYAPVDRLKELYDEAVAFPDVVGLSIGTRPDCVPEETLQLVQSYTDRFKVWLEYGLQSAHNRTLSSINRGHDYDAFQDAVLRTQGRDIDVVVHAILGLPGESREDMMLTAERISALPVRGLKLHHLYVAKGTAMADAYEHGKVRTLGLQEYVSLAADFIERTRPDISLQRLTGDTHGPWLIAPKWEVSKARVLNAITEELENRDSFQGALCGQLDDVPESKAAQSVSADHSTGG